MKFWKTVCRQMSNDRLSRMEKKNFSIKAWRHVCLQKSVLCLAEYLQSGTLRDLMLYRNKGQDMRLPTRLGTEGRVRTLDSPLVLQNLMAALQAEDRRDSIWRNCCKKLQTHAHQAQSRTEVIHGTKNNHATHVTMRCTDKKMILKIPRWRVGREKNITYKHIQINRIAISHLPEILEAGKPPKFWGNF